jgi:hypothetical protein
MPTRPSRTKPKRAASTSTVNTWQRKVARIGRLLNELYASMSKAQRR